MSGDLLCSGVYTLMLWSVVLQLILYQQICHDDSHEREATITLLSCCYFVTNGEGHKRLLALESAC
jgi:hypothetical protein